MKKLLLILLFFPFFFQSGAQCVSSIVVNNGVCGSGCTGVLAVQFSGGILPLTVTLTDGVTQYGPFTVTSFWQYGNLCAGTYSLIVIDANGDTCGGTNSVVIGVFPPPDGQVTVSNASCSGCSDGSATANVIGGTAPYNYLWSNGAVGGTITNLNPGVYSLTVTDANGCNDVDTFYVGVGANGYYVLSGNVYLDLNSNGIKDAGENGVGNQAVNMLQGNVTAFTNYQGDYGIVVAPGSYDINYVGASGWSLTSLPSSYNPTVSAASVTGLDFGIYPDSTVGSASVTLSSGWPRCFWDVPYYLNLVNDGFTALNGTLTFTHDLAQTFVSSSVAPLSQAGNVLTYSFTNLSPGQSVNIMVVLTEPAGGTLVSSNLAAAGSDAFGYQLAINTTLPQTITCSYDPNDKAVQPAGQGTPNFVTMDSWLTYMVRFQNTGTDTAFTVVIIDTLDADLNMNTFTYLAASHPVNVTTRTGNEITFTFDNILLPDSNVNEPASNGYVLYRIKGLTTLPDPTPITNTAYIYFDLNSPVQTNTTLTTLSDNFLSIADDPHAGDLFELFPNPMDHKAVLRLKQPSATGYTITISDIAGRVVYGPKQLENGSLLLEQNKMNPGTYVIEAKPSGNEKSVFLRLIKK
ncbi:MAG: T9SS type A sorting domain-containing protein [Bacteroidota bacterium]|nr:T9SS type A sorting domain-containing protein [Bacteroidota bacterium]